MARPVRFDDQVAIVTGAGGGLGRCFALELAQRGARVLVNDCGTATGSDGQPIACAEQVVGEIVAAGGSAVADTTPVGTADAAGAIAAAAIAAFGRIDILVNNAGICVIGRLDEIADGDALGVIATNLVGPYFLMRACWPHMRAAGGGRVLNVSSNASMGIGSNAPYALTKSGLLGLSLDAAFDGARDGILVNALLPSAYTRMTEGLPDKDFVAWYKHNLPAEIAVRPMLYFLSAQSRVTGQILSSGGGRVSRIAFVKGKGMQDRANTPELVREHVDEVSAFEDPVILCRQAEDSALYARDFPRTVSAAPPDGEN